MVEISNAQHASLIRLLSYFASAPADTVQAREAKRKSGLIVKALKKKGPNTAEKVTA